MFIGAFIGLGIGLMILAMITHATWDAAAAIADASLIGFLGVIAFSVLALVLLFTVMRKTGGQEREFLRAVLQPEVTNGTLTEDELGAACAPRKQRKRVIRARKGHRAHHTPNTSCTRRSTSPTRSPRPTAKTAPASSTNAKRSLASEQHLRSLSSRRLPPCNSNPSRGRHCGDDARAPRAQVQ